MSIFIVIFFTSHHRGLNYCELSTTVFQHVRTVLHCTAQDGHTALIKAAYKNHVTMVTLLLDRGANIEAADKVSEFISKQVREKERDVE